MESVMMTFERIHELNEQISEEIEDAIENLGSVDPEDIGLDRRSARQLWICEEGIFVRATDDRNLQYYGGFEYVHKGMRKEYGDYIFYSVSDDRVYGHLESRLDESA